MDELALRIAENQADIDSAREEARALQERWDACMRKLNPDYKPITGSTREHVANENPASRRVTEPEPFMAPRPRSAAEWPERD
jgi:hypothetical protein